MEEEGNWKENCEDRRTVWGLEEVGTIAGGVWRPECCIFMIGSKILKIHLTEAIFITSLSFLPSATTSDKWHAMLFDKELVGDGRGGDGNVEIPGRHGDGEDGLEQNIQREGNSTSVTRCT